MSTWRADTVGTMALRQTFGSSSTLRCSVCARVQALLVITGLIVWTVIIVLTFRCNRREIRLDICSFSLASAILTFVALYFRISSPASRTHAQWSVVQCSALCVSCAWVTFGTWVLASLVDTGTITCTFRIHCAFDRDHWFAVTVLEWIAHHADRTRANGLVTLSQTFRGSGAWIELRTWVDTHSVSACFCGSAFNVRTATWYNSRFWMEK